MPVQRLFFALWPDAAVRLALVAADGRLPRRLGRPVASTNYHITLVFLGAVADERLPPLLRAAAELKVAPFEFELQRFGYWPRPRVIWLAPVRLPPELPALAYGLRTVSEACGIDPDRRPYYPHLTLRRKVPRAPAWPVVEPVRWAVSDFSLVVSEPGENGSVYKILRNWPLRPGGPGC